MTADDFSLEFAIRIALTGVLVVTLIRTGWIRTRSWYYQRRLARTNGLKLLVTEDRLARVLIKSGITACLIGLICSRVYVNDLELRASIGDGLLSVITIGVLGLQWVDWFWGWRMDEYDRRYEKMHETRETH